MDNQVKAWFQSKAVWGGIVAVGAGVAGLFGHSVDADTQSAVADGAQQIASSALNVYTSLAGIAGGAAAVYGRIKANSTIGSSQLSQ